MVFNKDVLFIHLGNTGGMTVTKYLCNVLKPPVCWVVEKNYLTIGKPMGYETLKLFKRHASLVEAREFLNSFGIDISDFKLVFAVVRNPIDIEFSYFKHLRKERVIRQLNPTEYNRKKIEVAKGTFNEFAKHNYTHFTGNLKDFFELNGKIPDNMKILRFENLEEELKNALDPFIIHQYPIPHQNKNEENGLNKSLSDEVLLNIRKKYSWIYEKGLYPDLIKSNNIEEKNYLFIGGCGRSGTSVLTKILGSHHKIVLGNERYNKLMRKKSFSLSKVHFTKERFLTIQDGDTFYNDFNKFNAHNGIAEKFDDAGYFGVKYPPFDRIYHLMEKYFGDFKYIYIYRNIFDVSESWNRRTEKGGNWSSDKNYLKAVQRWNQSLHYTLKQLKNGADIICIHYDDLLFTNKPIQHIFDRLGIPIDKNVLKTLANARKEAPEKRAAKGKLSEKEIEFIKNNARFDLYDEINSKYNVLG
ncbi:MAG: sulfotransferase [Bacteroidales bacterium]|nr:sulfotransferase [Bacteroidales bacterium]